MYDVAACDRFRLLVSDARHVAAGAHRDLDRLRCRQLEIQIDRERGRLIDREDVVQAARADAALIRSGLLGMPNALAPQLVGLATPQAVRRILADWAMSTLTAWAAAAGGEIAMHVAPPSKPAARCGRKRRTCA